MMQTAPKVAILDTARLDKLLATEADALARLSTARDNVSTFCRSIRPPTAFASC